MSCSPDVVLSLIPYLIYILIFSSPSLVSLFFFASAVAAISFSDCNLSLQRGLFVWLEMPKWLLVFGSAPLPSKKPLPLPTGSNSPPPPPTYPLSYVKVSAHKIFKWFCRKFSSAGVREPSAWLLFKMFRLFKRHAESASCPPRGRGRSRIYLYIYIYIYLKICIYCGDTHMAGTLIRSGWQSKLWYSFPV